MSSPEAMAAPANLVAPASAARGKRKLLLVAAALLIALGGGVTATMTGLLPVDGSTEDPAKHLPQLLLAPDAAPGQPRYVTSYLRLDGAFTTNLAGSPRFVQVELGVSTRYDGRVLEAVKAHELPIRSAVLGVLAASPEEAVTTPQGRAQLQARLRAAINQELVRNTGFGGIEGVHFAGLVVQ
jgi:flagellar FliL protein